MLRRATRLHEVLPAINKSVKITSQDREFWVDTSMSRGHDIAAEMAEWFRALRDQPQHVLFAGHRGSGKSTELHTLTSMLKDEFIIVFIDAQKDLDILNLSYVDLLLLIMERVYWRVTVKEPEGADGFYPELDLDPRELTALYRCLQEVMVTDTRERTTELGASSAVKGALGALLGEIMGVFRTSTSRKVEVRQRIEPRIAELVERIAALNTTIERQLSSYSANRLLVIVENLDKLRHEDAHAIFDSNGSVMARLGTHVVYTIPNALYYGRSAPQILETFERSFLLPMIKINTRDGQPFDVGIDTLRVIVERRIDLSLLEPGALELAISMSGGGIRDLLEILTTATLEALTQRKSRIDVVAVQRGVSELKARYERSISGTADVPVEEYLKRLREVRDAATRNAAADPVLMDLLLASSVIEYNSERWLGVHPLVRRYLDELDQRAGG